VVVPLSAKFVEAYHSRPTVITASLFVARGRQVYMELFAEALLIVFLPKGQADIYRH
jgi:hypothetical protein